MTFKNDEIPNDELTPGEVVIIERITAGTYFVENEVPSGAVNGANTVYLTANDVDPASSLEVWVNGVKFKLTEDYTFTGPRTITMVVAPLTGSLLLVNYRRST